MEPRRWFPAWQVVISDVIGSPVTTSDDNANACGEILMRRARAGGKSLVSEPLHQTWVRVMPRRPPPGRIRHFTPRQQEILDLAVRGLTDKEIAADLRIAVSTVRTYLERLYRQNGLRNKTEAVAAWQHYREAVTRKPQSAEQAGSGDPDHAV